MFRVVPDPSGGSEQARRPQRELGDVDYMKRVAAMNFLA